MLNKTMRAVLVAGLLIAGAPTRTPAAAMTDHSSAARTVEVRLTEFRIEMPVQLKAGRTIFNVTNAGKIFHSLEIEGKKIEKEVDAGVGAGQTATLEVDLEPGVYEVYCPVHNHRKAGMSLQVQVN